MILKHIKHVSPSVESTCMRKTIETESADEDVRAMDLTGKYLHILDLYSGKIEHEIIENKCKHRGKVFCGVNRRQLTHLYRFV